MRFLLVLCLAGLAAGSAPMQSCKFTTKMSCNKQAGCEWSRKQGLCMQSAKGGHGFAACGTPVSKLKWKGASKASPAPGLKVADACDCERACGANLEMVSWSFDVKSSKCICHTASIKQGKQTATLQKVKIHKGGKKPAKSYSGHAKKGVYKSKVAKQLDALMAATAERLNPWSMVISAGDKKTGTFNRIYEFFHNTTSTDTFEVASQSKWVAAMAIVSEMARNGMTLDDPVCPYIAAWNCSDTSPGMGDPTLSIRHLLSFQSGNEDKTFTFNLCPGDTTRNITWADCFEASLNSGWFTQPVGKFFQYTHQHHLIAGAAIEGLTGKSINQFLVESLLDLGMVNSFWGGQYDFMKTFGMQGVDLIDMGATLNTNQDDLEKFHMAYILQNIPGIPKAMYPDLSADYFDANTTTQVVDYNTFQMSYPAGDNLGSFGSYGIGHWLDCAWTMQNPKGYATKWDYCHDVPDHHSMGAFGTLALLDVTRDFMVQSMPQKSSLDNGSPLWIPGGFNGGQMAISGMVSRVAKMLLNKIIDPSTAAIDPCYHLCMVQDGLVNYNATDSAAFMQVDASQIPGFIDLQDDLAKAIDCPPCPRNFVPGQAYYL